MPTTIGGAHAPAETHLAKLRLGLYRVLTSIEAAARVHSAAPAHDWHDVGRKADKRIMALRELLEEVVGASPASRKKIVAIRAAADALRVAYDDMRTRAETKRSAAQSVLRKVDVVKANSLEWD